MNVGKYKLKVSNDKGEEKKLRTVMSLRRTLKFAILDKQQIEYLNVTYFKRSKIIIAFDLVQDIDNIASKRTREAKKKSIRYINTAIRSVKIKKTPKGCLFCITKENFLFKQ